MKTVLITGAGSGIGQSLAWNLAALDHKIYIVGRNEKKLLTTVKKYPDLISPIVADVATEEGRATIVKSLTGIQLDYLVHNAGIEAPLAKFGKIPLQEWRYTQATNTEAPLFLTQDLLSQLKKNSRILFISSGLAHDPLPGVLAYCASKAALYMIYKDLKIELQPYDIFIGSVNPGAVQTNMQDRLRVNEPIHLGTHLFEQLERSGQLLDANDVADFIRWILLETSEKDFTKQEWDIENNQHTMNWSK